MSSSDQAFRFDMYMYIQNNWAEGKKDWNVMHQYAH